MVGAEVHVADLAGENVPVTVLNRAPRPCWRAGIPSFGHCESTRPAEVSPLDLDWDKAQELRAALEELRRTLVAYADLLATVAGSLPANVATPTHR